jgi:hypothetical protein
VDFKVLVVVEQVELAFEGEEGDWGGAGAGQELCEGVLVEVVGQHRRLQGLGHPLKATPSQPTQSAPQQPLDLPKLVNNPSQSLSIPSHLNNEFHKGSPHFSIALQQGQKGVALELLGAAGLL